MHLSRALPGGLLVAVLLLSILLGGLVASQTGLLVLASIGTIVTITASYFTGQYLRDNHGWLLIFGWLTMLFANVSQQLAHVPLGYVQEFLLFGLSLGIMSKTWSYSGRAPALRILIYLWLSYAVLTLVSTVFGRSRPLPALWQMQYNMKWPLMFCLGYLLVWRTDHTKWLGRIVIWSCPVLVLCVGFEIAMPGTHAQVFGPVPDSHQNPFLGWGLRYRGPFLHSGYLAIISALLASVSLALAATGHGRMWNVPAAVYSFLVVLAGQRQEFLALLMTCLLFLLILGARYWHLLMPAIAVLGAVVLIGLLLFDQMPLRSVFEQWGLTNSTAPLSERAVLTYKGVEVAFDFFPFGSGLGTYGGAGAQKFDQGLFIDLGFMRYWWFRQGLFLVDTFWPNVIAESGFFGALLLMTCYALLWGGLLRKTFSLRATPQFMPALAGLASLTLLLANSPTSGVLADPRGAFLFWLLIGAAWRATSSYPANEVAKVGRET